MPWIPEEEIKRAREITAIEYLKKYQPNRLKKSSARNEWELTDHDSFKINEQTSQWHLYGSGFQYLGQSRLC